MTEPGESVADDPGQRLRPPIRLVAGLGNPGRKYEGTRHNAGFDVLDDLARRRGVDWSEQRAWKGWHAQSGGLHLLKPATFMNLSGEAVGLVAAFHKLAPGQVLVVYDDKDLEVGTIRIRPSGSAGGHNGMRSVIRHLGTVEVPRLRVGIGGTGEGGLVGHVLGRFSAREREDYEQAVVRASEAVVAVVEKGIDPAMNIHNKRQRL